MDAEQALEWLRSAAHLVDDYQHVLGVIALDVLIASGWDVTQNGRLTHRQYLVIVQQFADSIDRALNSDGCADIVPGVSAWGTPIVPFPGSDTASNVSIWAKQQLVHIDT